MQKVKILLIFFISVIAFEGQTQTTWSLEKCVRYALDNSLTIKQANLSIRNAELTEKGNKAARYPSVNGSAGFQYNFGRSVDPTTYAFENKAFGSNNFSVRGNMLLYNGNRINNNIKKSKLDREAVMADLEQSNYDIAIQVANAYLTILFNEEQLNNAKKRLELSNTNLDQIDRLIQAGTRPRNERLDILAQIARDEQLIVGNENDLSNSYLSLKQLLQIDPSVALEIERPNIDALATDQALNYTLTEVYNAAVDDQPFIKAGQLRAESAELDIEIAKSGRLPVVSLAGSVGTNYSTSSRRADGTQVIRIPQTVYLDGVETVFEVDQVFTNFDDNPYFNQINENLGFGLGINVNVPIYDNQQTNIAVERARLNILNTQITNEQAKQRLKTDIQRAIADAKAAQKNLAASEKTLGALQVAYENTEKKYQLGASNTFELTTAKNNLEQAEVNLIVAKYDYLFRLKIVDYYLGNEIKF